jgi:hypothetical protein
MMIADPSDEQLVNAALEMGMSNLDAMFAELADAQRNGESASAGFANTKRFLRLLREQGWPRDAASLIDDLKAWQESPFTHKLTCGNNGNHEPLVPEQGEGQVILVCRDCDYVQTHIPNLPTRRKIEECDRWMRERGFRD